MAVERSETKTTVRFRKGARKLTNVAAEQTLTVGPIPPLFTDGFESGDTTGWSMVVGAL